MLDLSTRDVAHGSRTRASGLNAGRSTYRGSRRIRGSEGRSRQLEPSALHQDQELNAPCQCFATSAPCFRSLPLRACAGLRQHRQRAAAQTQTVARLGGPGPCNRESGTKLQPTFTERGEFAWVRRPRAPARRGHAEACSQRLPVTEACRQCSSARVGTGAARCGPRAPPPPASCGVCEQSCVAGGPAASGAAEHEGEGRQAGAWRGEACPQILMPPARGRGVGVASQWCAGIGGTSARARRGDTAVCGLGQPCCEGGGRRAVAAPNPSRGRGPAAGGWCRLQVVLAKGGCDLLGGRGFQRQVRHT